jgi:phosphate starvation-inducible membrane PsiE
MFAYYFIYFGYSDLTDLCQWNNHCVIEKDLKWNIDIVLTHIVRYIIVK